MKYKLLGFKTANLKSGQTAFITDLGKQVQNVHGLKVVEGIWLYDNLIQLTDNDLGKDFEIDFNEKGRALKVERKG